MILEAVCPLECEPLLQKYDHHIVHANGIAGILITYHWLTQSAQDGRIAYLLLNSSGKTDANPACVRKNVRGHPEGPQDLQETIDRLEFTLSDITLKDLM